MQKILLGALLVFLLCLSSTAGAAAPAAPVRLGYSALTFTVLPVLYGQEAGIFQQNGIDLKLQQIRGDLAIPAMLNNEMDYAIGVLPTVWAAAEGMPIRQIAGGQIKPAFSLIAQPEVNSFADLRGKLVGVSRLRSLASNLLAVILKKHGLAPNDVRMISLQTTNNVYITLDTKQITAGMLSVPLDIKAKLAGFKMLASAADYTTAYQGGIATTTKKIAEMPEVTERLLTAYVQSLRGLKANREAAVDVIVKHFKIDRPLAAASYDQIAPLFQDTPIIPTDVIEAELRTWTELTGKKPTVSAEQTMDMAPLQRVLKRLPQR
ncbi:MAG TPA: ABC transporter substrate-binding protein [Candidatus Binatia bacterium]|jgi:NitT/TauT family transport system substrate-binding protein